MKEMQIKTTMRYLTPIRMVTIKKTKGDFPGGPVVKNLPFNAGNVGSISGRELRSHMPQGK